MDEFDPHEAIMKNFIDSFFISNAVSFFEIEADNKKQLVSAAICAELLLSNSNLKDIRIYPLLSLFYIYDGICYRCCPLDSLPLVLRERISRKTAGFFISTTYLQEVFSFLMCSSCCFLDEPQLDSNNIAFRNGV